MIPPYDIYRADPEGPLWLETAEDLDSAKERVRQLLAGRPSEYVIVSSVTGHKISILPPSSESHET